MTQLIDVMGLAGASPASPTRMPWRALLWAASLLCGEAAGSMRRRVLGLRWSGHLTAWLTKACPGAVLPELSQEQEGVLSGAAAQLGSFGRTAQLCQH